MRLRRIIPALFPLLFAPPALAGAWTQPEGKGLFIAQATYFYSDQFFDFDGQRQSQPRFTKFELQPYVEYGATDWLTLGGSAYAQRVAQRDDSNWGLADTEFFARARLWQSKSGEHTLSLQPLIKLPSKFTEGGTPRGGSKSLDTELSLLYGRSTTLWGMPSYTDVRVGYRTRTRGLNDQWRVDSLAGLTVSEHWQLIGGFRGVIATKYDESAAFSEDGEQDYDLGKVEGTVLYRIDDQRFMHATYSEHVMGAFAGAGRALTLGYGSTF